FGRLSTFCLAYIASFFFFTAPSPPEFYTLSLHDALPISRPHRRRRPRPSAVRAAPSRRGRAWRPGRAGAAFATAADSTARGSPRSEEHTSELQSPCNLVCRLLLEKKKKK